jgi:hypothetical protein
MLLANHVAAGETVTWKTMVHLQLADFRARCPAFDAGALEDGG